MQKNKIFLITVIFALVVGFTLGNMGVLRKWGSTPCSSKFPMLKPSIDCELLVVTTKKMESLEEKIRVMIQGYEKTGKINRASVFVRDLKTTRFFGVNDTDIYYMASLLKTPLIIGGYKLAEVEPKILDQEIVYTGKPNLYDSQVIKSNETLEVGKSYKVKELMRRSIVYSDNTASQILFDFYPPGHIDRVLQVLGIKHIKYAGDIENLVTARSYVGIFRVLYNASYLTEEYSNEALSVLTKTDFQSGATSKLPKGTLAAHKFAERTVVYPDNKVALRQFHECGIVYAKDNPYIFCIMTEGVDYQSLETVLADTSLSIYEEMTKD